MQAAAKSVTSNSLNASASHTQVIGSNTTGVMRRSESEASWDAVPYENYGKLTNLKKNQTLAPPLSNSQPTPIPSPNTSGSPIVLDETMGHSSTDKPSSRAHTPYLITQRKSAAASLFEYDQNAPDMGGPVKVDPDEMVQLVKKQNRDARRRRQEEEFR